MAALTLPLGTNNTSWVRASNKGLVVIGKAADGWTNGTVNLYGRVVKSDGSQVDADRFLIKAYAAAPAAEVLDLATQDQIEIRFEGVGTNVAVSINYS